LLARVLVRFHTLGVGLAERGRRQAKGPPWAGSKSDSIPLSIPTLRLYQGPTGVSHGTSVVLVTWSTKARSDD
jgi:hypothetical protein